MALCTVSYVRSVITTRLTDEEIEDIIDNTGGDVLEECGTTLETHPLVILAGKNAILAATLRKMKTTGEMAASISTGNGQRQNTTDKDIEDYTRESKKFIAQYTSTSSYSYSSPSIHCGFTSDTICGGRHGHN